jgi:hypothetical protein
MTQEEFMAWESIEVFSPIYEVICETMALHGLTFARHKDEWRIVMIEQADAAKDIQGAVEAWIVEAGKSGSE